MLAYFDEENRGNLFQLSSPLNHRRALTFDAIGIQDVLKSFGFTISFEKNITEKGVYYISLREYSNLWSGIDNHSEFNHILNYIPRYVLEAVRNKKIIIVLDNQSEGLPMIMHHNDSICDGFKQMHTAMENLKIPDFSVVYVNGDLDFSNSYDQWLIDTGQKKRFTHCYAFTHVFYFGNFPKEPLLIDAINNPTVKNFSSLNRTSRPHRIEHIVELFDRNLNQDALISGHYTNDINSKSFPTSVFLEDKWQIFNKKLEKYFSQPLSIDGNWADMHGPSPDNNTETIFNHNIYKNSLLSVVTETAFQQYGLFVTEKTLKPIVAGHPFMVLGQYRFLEAIRRMGYFVDFPGIDQSYDSIINPKQRFKKFHDNLEQWCNYSKEKKLDYARQSLPMIKYNQDLYRSKDYIAEFYNNLIQILQQIFNSKL